MSLYTVVMDFEGGTYVAQVTAETEYSALKRWAQELNTAAIPRIGEGVKTRMLQHISIEEEMTKPMAVQGCLSVWCSTLSVFGRFMLLNIIKTAQDDKF